ncbi:MAG: hypothetical protein Q9218_005463 [Villophora microphyllina]
MADVLSNNEADLGHSSHAKDSLVHTLDDLLERYLNLVHQYHAQQQTLAKELSSGYFSLARANFSNPNRVRYGQDFYDDRMQAGVRLNIDSMTEHTPIATVGQESQKDTISISVLQPTRKSTDTQDEKSPKSDTEKEAEAPVIDPLRWFGILVPPTLRTSQSSFKHAVTEIVPSLANISNEMKELEIEIRRTRKKIRKAG